MGKNAVLEYNHSKSANSNTAICKSTGLVLIMLTDIYKKLKPDTVLLLGDRFETHAAAMTDLKCPVYFLLKGLTVPVIRFFRVITHSFTGKVRDSFFSSRHVFPVNKCFYDKLNKYFHKNGNHESVDSRILITECLIS